MIEELVKEQDKWHRRYNDALIEIAKLSKENESYKMAIHRLIMERDMAIRKNKMVRCKGCEYWNDPYEKSGHKYLGTCRRFGGCMQMDADDFCSRGEKRDDNEDKH